ncbi:hypothetical protein CHS0354_019706 [Potamilus streckersoni]|uniref:Uncharacterized protein n=1 Tax=Potamilus streckersoni TaxID=2493646 RepID=A0AAE0S9X6_9BIVA|nr:hypothetical protein CHS0354_019706 [Potamilus streckersoni]
MGGIKGEESQKRKERRIQKADHSVPATANITTTKGTGRGTKRSSKGNSKKESIKRQYRHTNKQETTPTKQQGKERQKSGVGTAQLSPPVSATSISASNKLTFRRFHNLRKHNWTKLDYKERTTQNLAGRLTNGISGRTYTLGLSHLLEDYELSLLGTKDRRS